MSSEIPAWIATVPNQSERKMWKNAYKAIQEHIEEAKKIEETSRETMLLLANEILSKTGQHAQWAIQHETSLMADAYRLKKITQVIVDIFPTDIPQPITLPPLTFKVSFDSHLGKRQAQEDATFIIEQEEGILAGVLDGHRGGLMAGFCCNEFPGKFKEFYRQSGQDLYQTFNALFSHMQKKAQEFYDTIRDDSGCAAVIVWIDKKKRYAYTSTIGDCEAFLFREGKAVPLSRVFDWSTPKEARRASVEMGDPMIKERWPKAIGTIKKELRIHSVYNLSRSSGDVTTPGMGHKPKNTMIPYRQGDTFGLFSDGVIDYIPLNIIAEKISKNPDARSFIKFATPIGTGERDNLSAVVVQALSS